MAAGCGSSASSGSLTFGTVLQGYTLRHARSSFGPADTVSWVAQFAQQVDPGSVTATVLQPDPACPAGRALTSIRLPVVDPNGKREAYQVPAMNFPVAGVPIPGKYTLRITQGKQQLAQGTFTLAGAPVGTIDFGRAYVRLASGFLALHQPTSTFRSNQQIAWVAHFAQTAGSATISIEFDRVAGCHATRVLRDDHIHLKTVSATSFATHLAIADLQTLGVQIPGTYIVSYTRGSRFLSRGEVTFNR